MAESDATSVISEFSSLGTSTLGQGVRKRFKEIYVNSQLKLKDVSTEVELKYGADLDVIGRTHKLRHRYYKPSTVRSSWYSKFLKDYKKFPEYTSEVGFFEYRNPTREDLDKHLSNFGKSQFTISDDKAVETQKHKEGINSNDWLFRGHETFFSFYTFRPSLLDIKF